MASGLVPTIGTPGVLEGLREPQRGLPAELDDDPGDRSGRPLGVHDLEHVLQVSGSK